MTGTSSRRQIGREAEAQEAEAELVGDGLDLLQVLAGLVADVVHGLQRRAGQLELAAGLQADVGPAALQADQGLAAVGVSS